MILVLALYLHMLVHLQTKEHFQKVENEVRLSSTKPFVFNFATSKLYGRPSETQWQTY